MKYTPKDKSTWPKWPNWEPDVVERQIGETFIPDIIKEYGDFKDAIHDPKLDHHVWYMLAYYNLSTFYNFAHAKYCLINIASLDETFKNNRIKAIFLYDFFISGFFLSLRTALDTLAAQIEVTIIHKVRRNMNLKSTIDLKTIKINAPKYKQIIDNASWYDEFNAYRNHLDHSLFLIRLVNPACLVDIFKLYPPRTKDLDENMLLQIYKYQNIYGKTPNRSNYRAETAYNQSSNYFNEAMKLCKEVLKLLKDDYNASLKPYIQSEITQSQFP